MRSAFHPLLGRFRIGASRLRPLFPKLHTSDCSSACPASSPWVDKVPSRDTPSLNLADHRKGVFPGDPQVTRQQCGYAYYGKAISLRSAKGKRRAYAYYRCCGSDAYRFGGERLCANPQVRTDWLDEAVWREVERVLQDPSWIAAEYERRLDQARDPTTVNLAGIEAQIAKLRRGMGRLIDGYAEGLIDKADFEPRVAGLRQRIKSWDEQATTLRDEVAQRAALSLVVGRLQDFVRQVRDRMSAVDWSLQRDLIRLLVKRV